MSETPSPEERKQKREVNILDRRNESDDTKDGITAPLHKIDTNLLDSIDDIDTRAAIESIAKGYAHMSELVTGRDPPEQEPYGRWHKEMSVSGPTVDSKTSTGVTVSVSLDVLKFYDSLADVSIRANERNNIESEPINSGSKEAAEGDTLQFTISSLKADTEYNLRAIAECEGDSDFSTSTTFKTDKQ